MTTLATMTFRVRNKGGPSGGKTLSSEFPGFDLIRFMKTPNAQAFIEKHYLATVKKILREIDESKNGSVAADLTSFESIVARSLSFTQEEVSEWMNSRDWTRATQVKDMKALLPHLEKILPTLTSRTHPFSEDKAKELADKVIAAVADNPDPIADFLFTTLTSPRAFELDEDFLL